jgi:hypothetical protein
MLNVKIRSYDQHFDTYACTFKETGNEPFESLIPATLLWYVAPKLLNELENLPFDAVGREFDLFGDMPYD